ncbi:PREDICTED: uncharacterized protein LOC105570362 [Vollenhovia emeryi]|uniref:uncharacterized protein LOC105570362 n=1 Tax=Vollenhovia emeryi TaxID=411798 RepID=UPI0005F51F69|nr:PREDICTED: uncharacterized protein LOC105570362 [Vollenhovia emeryi]
MRILKFNFTLLTLSGCWRPDSWSSFHKRVAYNIYTSIIVLLLNSFLLSQLMDVILTVNNADDFSENFFVLISMFISCCKLFILLMNRKNIIMLIDMLMDKPCRPSKSTEMNIFHKFDKSIQINTWRFVYLGTVTLTCIVLSSLSISFKNRQLTFRAWLPFDYSSTLLFSLMYTHQLISLIAAAYLNIGCDTLICGLLVHICCQIEILLYRLRKVVSYSYVLRDCIHQHYHIIRLAFIVNAKFRLTITIQFIMSTLVVCFSLYQISKITTKAKYIEMTLYISSMLTQIFFYCWYGNELKIKSQQMIDNIFEMEWLSLDENKKKSLMIIMRRTIMPIQITCAYIIPMNINSFMGILKTSYSTYNLLQKMRITLKICLINNTVCYTKFAITIYVYLCFVDDIKENNILKMQVLKCPFQLLTIFGCWLPNYWSRYKCIAYYIYTSIVVLLINTFVLSQLMDVILTVDNANDFADNFFILVGMLNACCKLFILLVNRKSIVMLINILMEKPCKPTKVTEINIFYKFDKGIHINTWRYIYLGTITITCIVLSSLAINFRNRKLTYRAWLPFNYSSTLLFSVMYTHQLISFIFASYLSMGCDTLICGLLVHICCQIEILTYRLRKIVSCSDILRDCVRQHYHIFRLAVVVNAKFRLVIISQFIMSTLVVCFSLYQLNTSTTRAKYIEMILFISSMLTQIFFYCWYGNEVKIKSHQMIDNIFEMEWLTLDQNSKKSLIIIMRRMVVPIQITCAYIVPMNLDSFMSILKASYSVYNLLQNARV